MKVARWQIILGASLVALSVLAELGQYLLFKDAHHIFVYLIDATAFVFIQVLLVALVFERVLEGQARRARLDKLNMVIGAFFSEVGTKLLVIMSRCDAGIDRLQQQLAAEGEAPEPQLKRIRSCLKGHDFSIDRDEFDWPGAKVFLVEKRSFLLGLLENANLHEHETFTDVLWAVSHLAEELDARKTLDGLPEADQLHLTVDANRAYGRLALQWLEHMEHLKANYPYLFSLSLRMNPFNRSASPIVQA